MLMDETEMEASKLEGVDLLSSECGTRSWSASSSRLVSFTHLTFDSLGPPQGEARRKDPKTF